jgi:hypothetical protein
MPLPKDVLAVMSKVERLSVSMQNLSRKPVTASVPHGRLQGGLREAAVEPVGGAPRST